MRAATNIKPVDEPKDDIVFRSPIAPLGDEPGRMTEDRAVELCDCVIDIVSALFGASGRDLRLPSRGSSETARLRQVAMYVAHVALGMRMGDVGKGFGRDRTTVMHACHLIEDLRDDAEFDRLIGTTERIAGLVNKGRRG